MNNKGIRTNALGSTDSDTGLTCILQYIHTTSRFKTPRKSTSECRKPLPVKHKGQLDDIGEPGIAHNPTGRVDSPG
jgi:hypothetical protein